MIRQPRTARASRGTGGPPGRRGARDGGDGIDGGQRGDGSGEGDGQGDSYGRRQQRGSDGRDGRAGLGRQASRCGGAGRNPWRGRHGGHATAPGKADRGGAKRRARCPSPSPTAPLPAAARGAQVLEEELYLLRDAQQALREAHPDRALALVDEHARRFPKGCCARNGSPSGCWRSARSAARARPGARARGFFASGRPRRSPRRFAPAAESRGADARFGGPLSVFVRRRLDSRSAASTSNAAPKDCRLTGLFVHSTMTAALARGRPGAAARATVTASAAPTRVAAARIGPSAGPCRGVGRARRAVGTAVARAPVGLAPAVDAGGRGELVDEDVVVDAVHDDEGVLRRNVPEAAEGAVAVGRGRRRRVGRRGRHLAPESASPESSAYTSAPPLQATSLSETGS